MEANHVLYRDGIYYCVRRVPEACVIHSFRYIILDRLRTIEWPADIIDAIGRWSTEGVGKRCALGFDLKLKSKWMKKLTYY